MENLKMVQNQAISLANSVEYSENSVVSKQVIKQPTGNVTLFAFDAGEGLSEHTAPFNAMVQILDGEAEILINNVSNIVKNGEYIIMPANIPHALKAHKRFKMMLIMIKS